MRTGKNERHFDLFRFVLVVLQRFDHDCSVITFFVDVPRSRRLRPSRTILVGPIILPFNSIPNINFFFLNCTVGLVAKILILTYSYFTRLAAAG